MKTHLFARTVIVAGAALVAACSGGGDGNTDAGGPPPDICNSLDEAFSAGCLLDLESPEPLISYVGQAGDKDWYGIQLPSTLTPRSILHVMAGYSAPNTAVNLTVNVLREDGVTSLARVVDRHGQGSPRPIDIILPFSEAGAKLVLLVSDEEANPQRPNFDARQPYTLRAEVVENPDENEPNDEQPTVIALDPVNGVPTGAETGYLATTNDVDRFTFTAPAGRKVAYLRVTAPRKSPPPPYRLSFVLQDPSGTAVAEARVDNEFVEVDLATARLTQPGTYTLVIQAYRGLNMTQPIPGDLELQYTVSVQLFDEVDANEPNDTLATAKTLALSSPGGAPASVTGRLGYVPDPDWYAVDIPASSQHTVLHYKLAPGSGGGRFPALPGSADRSLRAFTQVTTGATLQERALNCRTDVAVCPKGYDGRSFLVSVVDSFCDNNDPPLCLRSDRVETRAFANLKNFEGALPLPPRASTTRYYFVVQDSGNDFADDEDYTLTFSWRSDADETSRAGAPTVKALAEDAAAANFPVPPSGSAYEVSGTLSYGYGRLFNNDANDGEGVRAPEDYDAAPTDVDELQFSLPALSSDLTWMLQWDVGQGSGAGAPYDLSLELEFCDGARLDGGSCTPVSRGSKGNPLVLAFQPEALSSWHNASGVYGPRQPLFEKNSSGGDTTVTARAYGCFCFESRFVQGGQFKVRVGALDRERYEDTPYTLRTAFTSYPRSFGTDGGTSLSCPPPAVDGGVGGCQFTREP